MIKLNNIASGNSLVTITGSSYNPNPYPGSYTTTTINHNLGVVPRSYEVYCVSSFTNPTFRVGPFAPAHPVNNGSWLNVNIRSITMTATNVQIQYGNIEGVTPNATIFWEIQCVV